MTQKLGDLLDYYLNRRPGLSQKQLAEAIGSQETVISRMKYGKRIRGVPARQRLVRMIRWFLENDALETVEQANELLEAAGMAHLDSSKAEEADLIALLIHGGGVGQDEESLTPLPQPTRHNLPARPNTFIGRVHSIRNILSLMESNRLVMLTGPAGCGKTRLMLEVAVRQSERYTHGCWLIDLASISDSSVVLKAVANTLDIREEQDEPLLDTMLAWLKSRRILLLFDNCEHVLESCRELAREILHSCPGVSLLATSREALHLPDEYIYPVPPLSLPGLAGGEQTRLDAAITPEQLMHYEAIQLFVERAIQAFPRFTLNQENAANVAQICFQLDGIPLAIELAAARIKMLSVKQIRERLNNRFALLRGQYRAVPPRQQAMQAALDWSYELLTPSESRLFCRLAVFAAGFTEEAAVAVAGDSFAGPPAVSAQLSELVDKSLVMQDEQTGRYRMLQMIREYALKKLDASDEEQETRERFIRWSLAFCETAKAEQLEWVERVDLEQRNLRAALEWSKSNSSPEIHLRLVTALANIWEIRGDLSEGRAWLEAALDGYPPDALRARALISAGRFAHFQGEYLTALAMFGESLFIAQHLKDERGVAMAYSSLGLLAHAQTDHPSAREYHQRSLKIYRQLDDREGVAGSLASLGRVAKDVHNFGEAIGDYEAALRLYREIGNTDRVADTLNDLSILFELTGDYARAYAVQEESLSLFMQLGKKAGIATALARLGLLARNRGDYRRATELHQESMAIRKKIGEPWGIANSLSNLALLVADQGNFRLAIHYYNEGLTHYRRLGNRWGVALMLNGLGYAYLFLGELDTAARYCSESLEIFTAIDNLYGKAMVLHSLSMVRLRQGEIAEARARCTESLLLRAADHNNQGIAECFEGLAMIEQHAGQLERSVQLAGAAYVLRIHAGTPTAPVDKVVFERSIERVRELLGNVTYHTAWRTGATLALDQAVALALQDEPSRVNDLTPHPLL